MVIADVLAEELDLKRNTVDTVLTLFADGGTVPFVARYRKEATGGLDEVVLRKLEDRHGYLTELAERKETVFKTIADQGKLTDELKRKIDVCLSKTELEELYLPYKPKKRTRAVIAREKGLEPLAELIMTMDPDADPYAFAREHMTEFKDVKDENDAVKGACDILAEQIAETPEHRETVYRHLLKNGQYVCRVREDFKDQKTKYDMYYDFHHPVKGVSSHNMLAMRRGEKEGVLAFTIEIEHEELVSRLQKTVVGGAAGTCAQLVQTTVTDAYDRLMKNSIIARIRLEQRDEAEETAIETFASNLHNLLLSPPAGGRPIIGLDPGFRTGCKMVALDGTGRLLEDQPIYPTKPRADYAGSAKVMTGWIKKHGVELVAIGNGTASRETEQFVKKALAENGLTAAVTVMVVNESGASVYSASEVAAREFPEKDLTVRGAVSIARRLQDPLAELVKIDPKAIGVGQYQHDVNQARLKKKLDDVVESCVNFVGVDVNTASVELLSYVSGITPAVAAEMLKFRNENGRFGSREDFLKVKKLGPKSFEQSAGFLRIHDPVNPLDNSAVHPESYRIVEKMAAGLDTGLSALVGKEDMVKKLKPADYTDDQAGLPTVIDIIDELKKPGRDPRQQFVTAQFNDEVQDVKDLQPGMVLEGNVTNVANFGAFVDLGVHQDGLVHISEIANKFVKNIQDFVAVGDVVKVKVLDVDLDRKRIALSMKQAGKG